MTETNIPPGLIARAVQAARFVISGVTPATWFGPMQPLAPMAPADVAGRRFDYPTGYNLVSEPRAYSSVSFEDLRALADNCDILRSVIETRKDQIEALEWTVRAVPTISGGKQLATDDQKRRIDAITQFLHSPDKEHSFAQWLRQLLEDMFVIDAVALYKRRTRAGQLYALEVIDGATIKLLLDDAGRTPMTPDPAYQQVLKGVPAADYTRDELIYIKHNPRSHKVYGYSHVEQVMVTVNILIRRAMHQLEYYKDGSQPDAFVGLPKEWNQEQIAQFQKHFDAMLAGNLALRRRLRFMPGDFKYQETKAPPLKDAYDEFLARIICFVFSISPEPFVSQVNRATAESSQSRATDEGLAPLQRFVRGLINRIVKAEFASPDLEFAWLDTREQNPTDAATVDVAYVSAGILTVNEVRQNMGLGPLNIAGGEVSPPATPSKEVVVKNSSTTTASQSGSVKKNFRKFNPYHDPHNGQFTTAEGAGESDDDDDDESDTDVASASDTANAVVDGMNGASRLGSGTQMAANEIMSDNPDKEIEEETQREEGTAEPDKFEPISPLSSPAVTGTFGEDSTTQSVQQLQNLLMPEGVRIGQAGTSSDIREVQGGIEDAQALFTQLTEGGKVITDSTYKGTLMELPSGGRIGLRSYSTASPDTVVTIDIKVPNIKIDKIKFNP